MNKEVYVKCKVSPGMFSNEAVVALGDQSFVVPKDRVRNLTQDHGEVSAQLVSQEGREWIVLPTSYRDTIIRDANMELAG